MSVADFVVQVARHLEALGHIAEFADVTGTDYHYQSLPLTVDGIPIRPMVRRRRGWWVRYGRKIVARGLYDGEVSAKRLANLIHERLPAIIVEHDRRREVTAAIQRCGDATKRVIEGGLDASSNSGWGSTEGIVTIHLGRLSIYIKTDLVTDELIADAKELNNTLQQALTTFKAKHNVA